NVRVNGIAPGDTFRTDEIVTDIAARLGWDTSGVQTSSLNALPFDLIDGSWAEAGLSEMALLDDWRWLALHDARLGTVLDYGPFDGEWTVHRARDAAPELPPLPPYDGVVVGYVSPGGAPREVATGDVSPGKSIWREELVDRQPDDSLAKALAETQFARLSAERRVGRIPITDARDEAGRRGAQNTIAGATVRIADWDLREDLVLRVQEQELSDDRVVLGIEAPASVERIVKLSQLREARRRRIRRRHR
ncbi:MAG TPA: hypothetical protein VGR13_04570, partial [Actinomycetota bacterium]|nr:hypothetical protein [Actinomycetota bacterium]